MAWIKVVNGNDTILIDQDGRRLVRTSRNGHGPLAIDGIIFSSGEVYWEWEMTLGQLDYIIRAAIPSDDVSVHSLPGHRQDSVCLAKGSLSNTVCEPHPDAIAWWNDWDSRGTPVCHQFVKND